MKYIVEENLSSFEFWSGGKDRAILLTTQELDQFEQTLIELYGDDITDTKINDTFWFNFDFVCESLGLNIDEVYAREED